MEEEDADAHIYDVEGEDADAHADEVAGNVAHGATHFCEAAREHLS